MRTCGGKDSYNVAVIRHTPCSDRSIGQMDSEFSAMLLTIC